MKKLEYWLEGLDCAGCAAKVEAAVARADWVDSAAVVYMSRRLVVTASEVPADALADLQKRVDRVTGGVTVREGTSGGDAHAHKESGCGHDHDHEECGCGHDHGHDYGHARGKTEGGHSHTHSHGHGTDDEPEEAGGVMLVTTVLALLGCAVGVTATFLRFPAHEAVSAAGYLAAILLAGYDVMWNGMKSMLRLRLDESALMTVAMAAAAVLGEFPEGAMVALLYRIGEWLEDKAVDRSRRSIEALAEIRPDTAHVAEGKEIRTLPAETVMPGAVIVIHPHERVPLDCEVTEGASSVDSSALTGESVPIAAEAGTELLSGMMNGDGALTARVIHTYEDSAAARIIRLVTESAGNKGNAEKFVTRFALVYTPCVLGLALLMAVVPPLLGWGSFHEFIRRALTFLVASCPCAIVISVPLAFFASIGGASRFGVLVKGGSFAEALAVARAVAFDKTGTVTEGRPRVTDIRSGEGFTPDEVIRLAAAAEAGSVHPYAQAIRERAAASEAAGTREEWKNYSEISGHGVRCTDAAGRVLLCGGEKLMRQNGITVPDGIRAQAHVAYDGRWAGALCIHDTAAAGAKETVGELRALGFDAVTMLTGDGKDAARQIAESVGITSYQAELLPEDKVAAVEKLRRDSCVTVFVGDGINDAPVLAAADVGVAMGLGSGAAIEAADVVLSSNRLASLPRAVRHFRRTMAVIKGNITFALLFKAAVLAAAGFGYAPMWLAVLADVGVCLLCVANASQLIHPKP